MRDDLPDHCQRLYDAKAAQMILYGRALGLSHAEAEDVLQETFLAVMRLDSVPALFDHYCMRVFRNRALNYRRGLLRRLAREMESRRWFEPAGSDAREEAAVRRLTELPAEQREVIVLKIWQEYTFEEIAALVGVSPNTAAARYRYGLQKLRGYFNEMTYENDPRVGKRTSNLDAPPPLRPAARQNLRLAGG
jgi:RNA polymerase sigma-70 factor (ECF subfamily)